METSVDIQAVKAAMAQAFFDTYALYFKTHSYHWNVRSPDFHSAHAMLEEQYEELWEALDEIAERMRVFDLAAPTAAPTVTALPYGTSKEAMFSDLLADHEKVAEALRSSIGALEAAGDTAGADFLVERLAAHEKTAWMLRASVASPV